MAHALALHEIVKSYPDGGVRALDRISFDVAEGELLVLLGPSGCGKTTALRLVAGLLEPDQGEIHIGGRVVTSAPDFCLPTEKRNIGLVFQSYAIWPHMTVFENVAYPLRARRMRANDVRSRVRATLDMIGMADFEQRPATMLSGGQQQRVALARALVFEPDLLLLDEPLSNLDAKLRAHMRSELKALQRKTGIAMLFVTHDQDESMALADRVIVMNRGRIEQIGTPGEIYERPANRFVAEFIGAINLLDSRIVGPAGGNGRPLIALQCGNLRVYGHASTGAAPGTGRPVLASVRPEKLRLAAGAADGSGNSWPGRIASSAYYGHRREYLVDAGGHMLRVDTPSGDVFHDGDLVTVSCDPSDVVIIEDDRSKVAAETLARRRGVG